MQLPTTAALFALLSAASLTLAAPTTHNSTSNTHNTVNPINNSATGQGQTQSKTQPAPLQARLQLELERQTTFIQRVIPVPGRLDFHLDVFSAFIVSVEDASTGQDVPARAAVCRAFDAQENVLGGPIGLNSVDLNGGLAAEVAFIECVEA